MNGQKIIEQILIFMLIPILCLLTSCGTEDEKKDFSELEMDIGVLSDRLAAEITYDDTLGKIDDYVVNMLYGCEGLTVSSTGYGASGGTSEAVAVFECENSEKADELKKILETYRKSMAEDFVRYTPGEVSKLENAVIEAKGKYVVFCVSSDSVKAKEIINNYISELQK